MDNEFNNVVLVDLEPLGVSQKFQLDERTHKLRKDCVILISKFDYRQALVKCKELIGISKKLFFNEPLKYFYAFLTDSLLLAKCFIREDKFSQAEEVLQQGWRIFNKYITSDSYRITKVIFEEKDDSDLEALQRYINTTAELEDAVGLTYPERTLERKRTHQIEPHNHKRAEETDIPFGLFRVFVLQHRSVEDDGGGVHHLHADGGTELRVAQCRGFQLLLLDGLVLPRELLPQEGYGLHEESTRDQTQ